MDLPTVNAISQPARPLPKRSPRGRQGVALLCGLASLALATPSHAWSPQARVRLADEAVRMMPGSLRLSLETHRKTLLRGMLEPMATPGDARFAAPWQGGELDATIERETQALIAALKEGERFSNIAKRLGGLAHLVLTASYPPAMTDNDGASRYKHFTEFCDSRREKFPVVFYGHAAPRLQQGDYRGYAQKIMQRALENDRELSRAYRAAGDPPHPSAFDDRSVPFAVGSLSYSRAFTDVVRVWVTAWQHGGGDMGRTPYFEADTDNETN